MIPGKGNAIRNGTTGDLFIQIVEVPHQYYIRQNADLRRIINLTYPQLILGHKMELDTIDGGKIRFDIPAFAKIGDIFRIKGKGIKSANTYDNQIIVGDLLLVVDLIIPTSITEEERNLITELKKVNEKVATN
jgi:molecular chaperone DnaJ